MVTNLPPTFTYIHMDCHIQQLRPHHKAEVKKKANFRHVFRDSEHGVNGQFDLLGNLTLSTVH